MYKCIDCIIIYSLSGTQALKEASAYSINEFLGRGDASSLKVPWSPFLLPPAQWSTISAECVSTAAGPGKWGELCPLCQVCSTVDVPDRWPPCLGALLWAMPSTLRENTVRGRGFRVRNLQAGLLPNGWAACLDAEPISLLAAKCSSSAVQDAVQKLLLNIMVRFPRSCLGFSISSEKKRLNGI